jgi:starch phosphorylase
MHLVESGHFNQFEPGVFDAVSASVRSRDDAWMTAADFRSYVDAQKEVSLAYQDRERWTVKSILNTASSGRFSSDRTISEYNREIWSRNE